MASSYRTVVVDPPWAYDDGFWQTSHDPKTGALSNPKRVLLPYAAMTVEQIRALPVGAMADADAFLFLWTTNRYLADAFGVMDGWGFRYAQTIVWDKDHSSGLPAAIAPVHAEFLLMGKRGKPTRTGTFPSSVIHANRTKQHSTKPECFIDFIEQACPGPYVELFARRARFGWDYWGDQSLQTAVMVEDGR